MTTRSTIGASMRAGAALAARPIPDAISVPLSAAEACRKHRRSNDDMLPPANLLCGHVQRRSQSRAIVLLLGHTEQRGSRADTAGYGFGRDRQPLPLPFFSGRAGLAGCAAAS